MSDAFRITEDQIPAVSAEVGREINALPWAMLPRGGDRDAAILFLKAGFDCWHTGGGCVAWRKNSAVDTGYILATDEDGSDLPFFDDVTVVCRYDQEGNHLDNCGQHEALHDNPAAAIQFLAEAGY